jgi:PKD repeat protein
MSLNAGDVIMVRMGFALNEYDPHIRVYGTDGTTLLCGDYTENNYAVKTSAEISGCQVPGYGEYTIVASEYNGNNFGPDYNLTVERLNNTVVSMTYGDTVTDTLTATADLDAHTFTASANDRVKVRMGFTTNDPDPQIRIFGPGGDLITSCEAYNTDGNNAYSAEISNCLLPDDGVYTVISSEYEGDETGGDYNLTIERLNNTVATMSYGDTVLDALSASADLNPHTFTASANDRVMVKMGFTTAGPGPQIRIYGPNGETLSLCEAYNYDINRVYAYSAEISSCLLDKGSGTYTIIASESNGDETGGSYSLAIERLNNTAATMSFGQTVPDSLPVTPDIDAHTFTAEANDRVMVTMGFTTNGSDPYIRIFGPYGNSLSSCQAFKTNTIYGYPAEMSNCLLPASGTYTVITSEWLGDETGGDYNLSIERLNNTAATMSNGDTVSNELLTAVDLDAHTFTADANDRVMVTMGFAANGPDPYIRIFNPDGTAVCNTWRANTGSRYSAEITNCLLQAAGTYTIIASEFSGDEIGGDYSVTLERLNNTVASMTGGDTLTVTSDFTAQTFNGSANDHVKVTMQFGANGPDPYIRMYDIEGLARPCYSSQPNDGSTNYPAEFQNCILPDDGTYTIIASENYGDEVGGGYSLSLEFGCLPEVCNDAPIADPGGPYTGIEGEAITLDGSGSYDPDGYLSSYKWDVDNDGTYEYNSPTPQSHVYTQDGTYTIRLRVMDNKGGTDIATTTANISDTSPTAGFSGSPTSGLVPLTVNFTGSSTGYDQPLTYEWDFDNNGATDSTEQNPSYEYTDPGTYTVKLTVTDSDGSPDTLTMTDYITVTTPPEYDLTITKTGTGSGTVTSSPAGIDCGADCTEIYVEGTVVTLSAVPDAGSYLTGWSDPGCSGTGDCAVTMNDDTDITATFDSCTNPPVRINGATPVYYSTLQAAYDAAQEGDVIQSQSARFVENLDIDDAGGKYVILEGGYDCGYTNVIGKTRIKGRIKSSMGKARGKNFKVEK